MKKSKHIRKVSIGIMVFVLFLCTSVATAFAGQKDDSLFDVKADYKAKGNGTADDTKNIQKAIDDAQRSGGGVVYFPKGKYKITSALTVTGSNVILKGIGKASVLVQAKDTGAVVKIGNPTVLDKTTFNKVVNLTIDRAVAPNPDFENHPSYGIFVERARFTDIDGVTVYNAGYGIAVGVKGAVGIPNQFTNIVNSRVMLAGSVRGSSAFPGANVVYWSGADHKMTNTFLEPTHVGVSMEDNSNALSLDNVTVVNGGPFDYGVVSTGTGFARYITNSILENAKQQQIYITGLTQRFTLANSWLGAGDSEGVKRGGVLIDPKASKVTILGNRIGHQKSAGVLSQGNDVIISNNIFEDNVTSGVEADSLEVRGGENVTIQGNRIFSPTDRSGIGLYDGSNKVLNHFIVTGNDLSDKPGLGILNQASGESAIVKDNQLPPEGPGNPQERPTYVSHKAATPVTTDGVKSAGEWDNAGEITVSTDSADVKAFGQVWGAVDDAADLTAKYRVKWDDDYLYLLDERTSDDVLQFTETGGLMFLSDATMMFLNLSGEQSGADYKNGDFALFFTPSGPDSKPHAFVREGRDSGKVEYATEEIKMGSKLAANSYTLEVAIPWSLLKTTPSALSGFKAGFSLLATDRDDPNDWGQIMWVGNGDGQQHWASMILE
ncbi:sugar-binding protein [Paenibacillus nasutitermitis]|uniref:Carbohydrate-binding domain-containing protein n=1 Tax=Paenibacillus nasutitermitis TaxID=1652958 RepID=A0A917DZL9_9BACL|nr:sugar-binding protein [Paenibacillus nasutitermitis]GGD85895.1 hypothetical protein GCM10010911_50410 [Paenibacillus nasutitermitis]